MSVVRMWLRSLAVLLALALAPLSAFADEQINLFDVTIEVQTDGDVLIRERIEVTAEGNQIRRGIFRDLPRYYTFDGRRLRYDYDVISVRRDGRREPYARETDGNAVRIRIGDADRFLDPNIYTYEIEYLVKNQIRYGDEQDEIYWNATGTYWAFPITKARARVALPEGARVTEWAAYTGRFGADGQDFRHTSSGTTHTFETTRVLERREGLTVAVAMEKGLIDPPSVADETGYLWQRYGALGILILSTFGVGAIAHRNFERVGRDPPKPPVFPIYEPPGGLSPAGAHYVFNRGAGGKDALIATLLDLAIKGRLTIDATLKKETTLTRVQGADLNDSAKGIAVDDLALERSLFASGDSKTLGGKYDASFTRAFMKFKRSHAKKYGDKYFRWNIGYTLISVILSAIGVGLAITQAVEWTIWHSALLAALAGVNLLFMYLMPAPTRLGQDVRTKLEGFRLYMNTAEKLQLNATEIGVDKPPMMSKERYERFLPYAIALGVEKPWSDYFEKTLPEEAANYHPSWGRVGSYRSIGETTRGIVDSMSTGVATALPQSSSSSGSGGGGFSGGGGGGGGGGGW